MEGEKYRGLAGETPLSNPLSPPHRVFIIHQVEIHPELIDRWSRQT